MDFRTAGKRRNEKRRQAYARRRQKALAKLGGKCKVCGEKDPCCLHIDHIEPLYRLTNGLRPGQSSEGASHSITVVNRMDHPETEFQLLCANCHAKKTVDDRLRFYEARASETEGAE
jgi:5-methylcytosine-specific restriction endonuclease McrA